MMNGETSRAVLDERVPVPGKSEGEPLAPLAVPLTEREREILCLVVQGWTNQQIADELIVAHTTVRWYLRQIYSKLGVDGRAEAVTRAQALGLVAGPAAPPPSRSNLPTAPTGFVGRRPELQALGDLLLDPGARLVTICGPGGIGKTRLALALAECQVARLVPGTDRLLFPDGVWFAALAPVQTAAELVAAVAQALGLASEHARRKERTPEQQVVDFLRDRRLLLVLDNLEHLADAEPFLAQMLKAGPQSKLVVTSRRRLQLREEHLFPLAGLPVPADERAADAAAAPAVHLFVERARRVQPALVLDEAAVAAVVRICRLLEGMPLAIELSASWAGLLPPAEIEQEVQRGLDILAAHFADVPPRHRSMQTTLDISWRQLDPTAQDAFRQLSVFRGGFTRDAACDVAGATLPVLKGLLDGSWLTHDLEDDRYYVQELLRQYGEARLHEEPELEDQTRERHAAYYAAFLESRALAWFGPAQQEVLATVHLEIANARRAWRYAVAHGRVDLLSASLESLLVYYDRRCNAAEKEDLLRMASEALLRATVPVDDDIARRRLLARLYIEVDADTLAEVLVTLDQAEIMLRDLRWEKVDVRQEEACLLAERAGLMWRSDPRAACPLLLRSLSLFEQVDHAVGAAKAAQRLAAATLLMGDPARAIGPAREALRRHQKLGNESGVLTMRRMIGLIEREQGRLEEALQTLRETYARQRETDTRIAGYGAGFLVETLAWMGAYEEAHAAAVEALYYIREKGLPWWETFIRSKLVLSLLHLGRCDEAEQMTAPLVEEFRARRHRQWLGWTLAVAGQCALASGRDPAAVELFEESAGVLQEFGHASWMLGLLYQVYPLLKLGEAARAERVLARALAAHGSLRLYFVAVNAVPAAARLLAAQGDVERAVELYALACTYPYVANSCWYEDVVGCELAEAAASLPPDVVAAAQARGQALDLWTTVEGLNDLLAERNEGVDQPATGRRS